MPFARARRSGRRRESRGAQSRLAVVSLLADDKGAWESSFKEAASDIMPESLRESERRRRVSGKRATNHVRGAAYLQKETDKELGDNYFTQTLLPNYLKEDLASQLGRCLRLVAGISANRMAGA